MFERILVGTDGSPTAAKAVDRAADVALATRFLLGSVPNKVSHHVPCSPLIVHTT